MTFLEIMFIDMIVWTHLSSKDNFFCLFIRSVNIHVGDVTPRISFHFIVTMPNDDSDIVPRSEVEEAIRWNFGSQGGNVNYIRSM